MSSLPPGPAHGVRAGNTWDAIAPEFAVEPGPGQESVWDYPRPPAVVSDGREVVVLLGGTVIARTVAALRILETASPPTFYIPPGDVEMDSLAPAPGGSLCEWKGEAQYWSAIADKHPVHNAGWSYPHPFPEFASIRGYISFYPAKLECLVDGKPVAAQPGGFYGGWVTSEVVGPFKGEPGSSGW